LPKKDEKMKYLFSSKYSIISAVGVLYLFKILLIYYIYMKLK